MAVFTIELVYAGSGSNFVFPYTPFLAIKHRMIHGPTEPPTVVGVEDTWELSEAVFLGSDTAVRTLYEQLRTQLRDRTNQITGVLFKKDAVTVDSMTTSTHQGFKVLSAEFEKGEGKWLNHLKFDITIRGVKGVEDPSGGDSANVTKLEIRTEYSYSREGLLSQTRSGTVHTVGAYALARARTLGQIALPDSGLYTYLHYGPEGVNVTQEDQSNTRASFTCTIVEQRNVVPTGAYIYDVSRDVEKFRHHRMVVTNFTISAASITEAESMANELKPTKQFLGGGFKQLENTNTIQGSWSQYIPDDESIPFKSYRRNIRFSGGGRNLREFAIMGSEPVLLFSPLKCYEIQEQITLQVYRGIDANSLDKYLEESFKDLKDFLDGLPEYDVSLVDEGITDDARLIQHTKTYNWKVPPSKVTQLLRSARLGVELSVIPGGDYGSIAIT